MKIATWENIAEIYEKETFQCALIRPMLNVLQWVESRKDLFVLNENGTFSIKEAEE